MPPLGGTPSRQQSLRGCAQIDKTLAAEQKRADFQPRGDGALALDMPTDACVLVTALLRAVMEVAADTLHPGNLGPFLAEVRATSACDHTF
jgi:hypothetical protein